MSKFYLPSYNSSSLCKSPILEGTRRMLDICRSQDGVTPFVTRVLNRAKGSKNVDHSCHYYLRDCWVFSAETIFWDRWNEATKDEASRPTPFKRIGSFKRTGFFKRNGSSQENPLIYSLLWIIRLGLWIWWETFPGQQLSCQWLLHHQWQKYVWWTRRFDLL